MCRAMFPLGVVAAVLALAGSPARVAAGERPFYLQGAGQLSVDPDTVDGTFTASGRATHLGRWTNEGTIQFTPAGGNTLAAVGEVTFTAANGDTVHMTIDGVLDLGTGMATATFTVDGGTGRFAGAEGEADSIILQNPDGSFSFSLDGVIDY